MDKIIIKDLMVRGILGLNPEERVKRQDILINIIVYTDIGPAAASDDITYSVNYKTISKAVIERVENGDDLLVEKLVTDIARMICLEHDHVQRVMVRVEKPTALRFAESVGVEIERSPADFA